MSTARQRRRGNTANHSGFTGLLGEWTFDTDKKVVVCHDGSTAGGFPMARPGLAQSWTAAQTFGDGFLKINGLTSGAATIKAAAVASTYEHTLPAATGTLAQIDFAQTWSAAQTYGDGNVKLSGATSGATTLKAAAIASTYTVTLPAATTTLAGTDTTDTLTNKRAPPRITTITSSATPTINTDNCDMVTITALAAAITSFTTNLSGTPTNGEILIIRIKDDGTARALTFGASFAASGGVALPTTTVVSTVLTLCFQWDSVAAVWRLIGKA